MTTDILKERQAWTLAQKVDHALATIDVFISRMGGIDKVYCSFSGGKDSTVLLHLCRILYPDILAVFCSTGNEYQYNSSENKRRKAQIYKSYARRLHRAKYGRNTVFHLSGKKRHKRFTKCDLIRTPQPRLSLWEPAFSVWRRNGDT